jgi:hypothetical protein
MNLQKTSNVIKAISFLIISIILVSVYFFNNSIKEEILGTAYESGNNAGWFDFFKFTGYQTNIDPTKLEDGGSPMGQNTSINNGDRISVRKNGYEVFPDTEEISTSTDSIKSLHNFRKRSGENILIRTSSTTIEYFEENNDTWEILKDGLTPAQKFGFSDYNINTDLQSYTYFGNAVDNAARWTGVSGLLSSDLNINDSFVFVDNIDSDESFLLSSGNIIVCGVELAYTTFDPILGKFSLSASSTVSCAEDRSVAETVEELPLLPKGNIYLVTNNRLFISGIASTSQAVYFSEYGDATNFVGADLVTDSTATAPGIFNLGLGGGPVTGMVEDENSIYIFKRSIIRKATLTDTLYTLTTLKSFDGKGQTVGSISSNGLFTGGNEVFFVTTDNQIMRLGRIENFDTPQMFPISEIIKPTINDIDFTETSGIVFQNKAYFQGKTNGSNINNVVFVRNLDYNFWESPIVGWNSSEFVVYDDGTGESLYFSDSAIKSVYRVVDGASDAGFDVLANWRSKRINFGMPSVQKEVVDFYIEGYISENTELFISLLVDEDGFTQVFNTSLLGTDTEYLYDSTEYNVFGLSPFGSRRFGSQEDISTLNPFRVYLGKEFVVNQFYNVQVEFLSDGLNQEWEITSFGLKAREYSDETKRELYKSFKE